MKWLVATRNRDKLVEIQAIFADLLVELLDLEGFPQIGAVEETGKSLEENALLKARSVWRASNYPAIADDTGLEVDALDGAPGIYAARFAGNQATYADNQDKLLRLMQNVPDHQRTARFRTCAAYVDDQLQLAVEGMVEGMITREPSGLNGFGYDPVFLPKGSDSTFGEMTVDEKQQISHRARAFQTLHQTLLQSLPALISKEAPA